MAKERGRLGLSETVRLVVLQFRFSKADSIPLTLSKRKREFREDEHRHQVSGRMIIQPTQRVTPGKIISELEAAGYDLVDAFCKERVDESNPLWMREFTVVQFVLARREEAHMREDFRGVRDLIRKEFETISTCAMWKTCVYLNPFYGKDGRVVEGLSAISVNFGERKPYLRPDGTPEMVWARDGKGEKIGDAPNPLKPAHRLRVESGAEQVLVMETAE